MLYELSAADRLVDALNTALDDEYQARARYQKVLQTYGDVAPFSEIASAEERHVAALVSLYRRYGFSIPLDPWQDRASAPDSLLDACLVGISAEIRNYQMYDYLLTQVDQSDVRTVFVQLRNASAYQHLPAFESCALRLNTSTQWQDGQSLSGAPKYKLYTPLLAGIALGVGAIWAFKHRGLSRS